MCKLGLNFLKLIHVLQTNYEISVVRENHDKRAMRV